MSVLRDMLRLPEGSCVRGVDLLPVPDLFGTGHPLAADRDIATVYVHVVELMDPREDSAVLGSAVAAHLASATAILHGAHLDGTGWFAIVHHAVDELLDTLDFRTAEAAMRRAMDLVGVVDATVRVHALTRRARDLLFEAAYDEVADDPDAWIESAWTGQEQLLALIVEVTGTPLARIVADIGGEEHALVGGEAAEEARGNGEHARDVPVRSPRTEHLLGLLDAWAAGL
ncbi:hypothetical protein ACXET9_15295 [Brachybacterium sp. DNPG3]